MEEYIHEEVITGSLALLEAHKVLVIGDRSVHLDKDAMNLRSKLLELEGTEKEAIDLALQTFGIILTSSQANREQPSQNVLSADMLSRVANLLHAITTEEQETVISAEEYLLFLLKTTPYEYQSYLYQAIEAIPPIKDRSLAPAA